MKDSPLGRKIALNEKYDSSVLFAIPRKVQREKNNIKPVFTGYDVWNCYELSWINTNGIPENRIMRIIYSSSSQNMVESKSLKLYLFGFSMMIFKNENEVINTIKSDLEKALITDFITISLFEFRNKIKYTKIPENKLIDSCIIKQDRYEPDISLLRVKEGKNNIIERYSNMLKTNCPVTGQPDWATVHIKYKSKIIIEDSNLLSYIISYRNHSDFHEACCEKIFSDLFEILAPEILIVKCFYTRRGGIDINPCRFYGMKPDKNLSFHYWRQ